MKKYVKPFTLLIIGFLLVFINAPLEIHGDNDPEAHSARILNTLGIMQGDTKGNLNLQNKITRSEFVTLVIRMMGYDNDNFPDGVSFNFHDNNEIKQWALKYIKIALKYDLIKGYNDNTLKPNALVTNAEAQTIILRALGYGNSISGSWPESVLAKSEKTGLTLNIDLTSDHELTRGETSVLIYNALTIPFS